MIPDPLHPAIVHFPVVLAVLLPLFAIGAAWAIRRGASARRAWAIPVSLAAALAVSAWAAVETGEAQDERVERVVAEQPLETHEESAEVFLAASALLVLLAVSGFAPGVPGRVLRVGTVVGSLALVVVAARVGHSGGELVYKYGAADAYASSTSGDSAVGLRRGGSDDDDERR
jgi:uncharacterized membrane protein